MREAANGSAAAPGANHDRGARMAVTPCPLPLSDFPPDLIQAVARDAARDADRVAVFQALRLHRHKGLRLDDGVTGADLTRPGFRAVIDDALADRRVSHVF